MGVDGVVDLVVQVVDGGVGGVVGSELVPVSHQLGDVRWEGVVDLVDAAGRYVNFGCRVDDFSQEPFVFVNVFCLWGAGDCLFNVIFEAVPVCFIKIYKSAIWGLGFGDGGGN